MKVALFVPCYVDQLAPRVGMATVEVLERHGCEVDFPEDQTCCGQPFLNAGWAHQARGLAERMLDVFAGRAHVVCPSASCTAMVRRQFAALLADDERAARLAGRTFELCEFLTDVLGVERVAGSFPHRVGLHQGCHGLRELNLGGATERADAAPSKVRRLLTSLDGLQLVEPERPDECCGFGGTFSVTEPAVSCAMGRDRLADHERARAEVITSTDSSCLMHLEGLRRRDRRGPPTMHVAQILAGDPLP